MPCISTLRLVCCSGWLLALLQLPVAAEEPLRVAGIVTVYRPNSHADVILGRLLKTETLDGRGRVSRLKLVSLYVDQQLEQDLSCDLSHEHGFRLSPTIRDALTHGSPQLAVDGVLVIAEHGEYPLSPTQQIVYPKRRFFEDVLATFAETGAVVPVFSDKHLADNTPDALWIYNTVRTRDVPLMAGSSITSTWRTPPIDTPRDEPLSQIMVLSYGPLDAYGFHGLDLLQSLAERRAGGETGVRQVRCLSGAAVWQAFARDELSEPLMMSALGRMQRRSVASLAELRQQVQEPVAFLVDYRDGTRGSVVTLNGAIAEWTAAWQLREQAAISSTVIDLQDEPPYMHFGHLLRGIEPFMFTQKPAWPVERTLFSTLMLDAALTSRAQSGAVIATPDLQRSYETRWDWSQPDNAGR